MVGTHQPSSQSRHKLTQSAVRDYLMSTSHDMRTPAHGIMTAAQLLQARPSVIADQEASFLVTAMHCACSVLMSKARQRAWLRSVRHSCSASDFECDGSARRG